MSAGATHPGAGSESTVARASGAFRRRVSGTVTVASEADDEPGLWHETGRRPMVRVECADLADVRTSVRIAADHGLPVAVWGGRRDVHGRNAGAGEVVVDLRRLRHARFDAGARTVSVGGGATVRDVLAELPADQVTVTTSDPDVGMAGASAGGGYGPLLPRYGLLCDQLVSARLVLADGTAVEADEELLWGLRGGGTGFGVLTEATFKTHPLDRVLNAIVTMPLTSAVHALTPVQDLLDEEPDRMSVVPVFTAALAGEPVLHLLAYWSGPAERGEQVLRVLDGLPGAVTAVEQWVPYTQTFSPAQNPFFPAGRRWSSDTRTFARLDRDIARHLVEAARAMPSSTSVLFVHDFHGAPARIPPDATAFPLRRDHFVLLAADAADPGDEVTLRRNKTWVNEVMRGLEPVALPGGYVNFLSPTAGDRVAAFYGEALPRLTDLKKRYDPGSLFGSVTGIGSVRASS